MPNGVFLALVLAHISGLGIPILFVVYRWPYTNTLSLIALVGCYWLARWSIQARHTPTDSTRRDG